MNKIIFKKQIFIYIAWLLVAAMFFIGDRLLKQLALANAETGMIKIINNWLYFNFFPNPNIALSLPIPNNLALIIATGLTGFLIFLIFYLIIKQKSQYINIILLTFIVIGAISNIIDRWHYGYVIDYLYIPGLTNLNLADIMISGGAIIYLLFSFKKEVKNEI